MNSRDFCFWLQGFFELTTEDNALDEDQIDIIKKHLNLVFVHEIDPAMGDANHQKKLNDIHDPWGNNKNKDPSTILMRC